MCIVKLILCSSLVCVYFFSASVKCGMLMFVTLLPCFPCSVDNYIGLLSGTNFEDISMISHDNATNRWISTFRYCSTP